MEYIVNCLEVSLKGQNLLQVIVPVVRKLGESEELARRVNFLPTLQQLSCFFYYLYPMNILMEVKPAYEHLGRKGRC